MDTDKSTNELKSQLSFLNEEDFTRISARLFPEFTNIINQEGLGEEVTSRFDNVYLPLAAWIADKHKKNTLVIGINGAQGSGKSTLSKILKSLLYHGFGKTTFILSIDDLYLSKQRRLKLAQNVHKLLNVRGVPGTHDVELGINIFNEIKSGKHARCLYIPIFDKAQDDLLPESEWRPVSDTVDIILFEGWCVGSLPQQEHELDNAINELERKEDQNGKWRTYVNQQLNGRYSDLFGYIDYLIMLQVPGMDSVFEWRKLQEKKLEEQCRLNGQSTEKIMSDEQVEEFIMYYERITRHTLNEMPNRADVLLKLDKQHQVAEIRVGE